jgi:large subunit ribosomal protein L24
MKIRRGDSVVITTGEDASSAPRKVTQVLEGGSKLIVEGANRVLRHVRRGHPKSPQGGRLNLEMPISASNVMLYCGACNRGVRAGYRFSRDGAKERFCKKCSQSLGAVSPAKARHAAK